MKRTCIYVEDLVYYHVIEFYLKKLLYSQRGGLLNVFIWTATILSYRGYGLISYTVEKVNPNIDYNLNRNKLLEYFPLKKFNEHTFICANMDF
jgi:hypothetical protein